MNPTPHRTKDEALAALAQDASVEAAHSYRETFAGIAYGPVRVLVRKKGVVSDMLLSEAEARESIDKMRIQSTLEKICAERNIPVDPPVARTDGACSRCGKPAAAKVPSIFNEDMICMECKGEERKHPRYLEAAEAEVAAMRRGDLGLKGIGWPPEK